MVPQKIFIENLSLISHFKNISGDVVECGVWRGGMVAGIVGVLGKKRSFHLFDSFEGLPKAQEVDGETALAWQNNKKSSTYFDNCAAEIKWAEEAMNISESNSFYIHKGWFSETLPLYNSLQPISILRLDGDWYESTMDCLNYLYPNVTSGGIIIIDDYYLWDGCAKAVHDYLSINKLNARIKQYRNGHIHYIVKP